MARGSVEVTFKVVASQDASEGGPSYRYQEALAIWQDGKRRKQEDLERFAAGGDTSARYVIPTSQDSKNVRLDGLAMHWQKARQRAAEGYLPEDWHDRNANADLTKAEVDAVHLRGEGGLLKPMAPYEAMQDRIRDHYTVLDTKGNPVKSVHDHTAELFYLDSMVEGRNTMLSYQASSSSGTGRKHKSHHTPAHYHRQNQGLLGTILNMEHKIEDATVRTLHQVEEAVEDASGKVLNVEGIGSRNKAVRAVQKAEEAASKAIHAVEHAVEHVVEEAGEEAIHQMEKTDSRKKALHVVQKTEGAACKALHAIEHVVEDAGEEAIHEIEEAGSALIHARPTHVQQRRSG
eukprot:gnl/TRDRNA2_/TRDRNA2_161369_c0_seq3.p1 gnl/TRDRNA2_/TRDRNA2_161369_c0~~gnl/TRDRNA2_/TRDRNA2_161369_c0_seq3.p1  ORF type:complete len:347 (+),score=46.51 gnl/TRDRNA2_/TRDRNA2_161369_c0_seq3:273-1313(+)